MFSKDLLLNLIPIYIIPLNNLMYLHGFNYHILTDNLQIYLSKESFGSSLPPMAKAKDIL